MSSRIVAFVLAAAAIACSPRDEIPSGTIEIVARPTTAAGAATTARFMLALRFAPS